MDNLEYKNNTGKTVCKVVVVHLLTKIISVIVLITVIAMITNGCGTDKKKKDDFVVGGVTEPKNTFDIMNKEEQKEYIETYIYGAYVTHFNEVKLTNLKETYFALDLEDDNIQSDDEKYLNHYKYVADLNITKNDNTKLKLRTWITPTGKFVDDYTITKQKLNVEYLYGSTIGLYKDDAISISNRNELDNLKTMDFDFYLEVNTELNRPLSDNENYVFNGKDIMKELLSTEEVDNNVIIVVNEENKDTIIELVENCDLTFTNTGLYIYYNDDETIEDLSKVDLNWLKDNNKYDTFLINKSTNK